MHSKLIILFFLCFVFSQSYYESATGRNFDSYSALSLSMASSSQVVETSGFSILSNPSNLSRNGDSGFIISGSNFIDSNLENNHILICCVDGINISPFIASLYLVKYGEIEKSEIKKIIQSKNQAVSMDFDLSLLDL